jgi:hypothetical protein
MPKKMPGAAITAPGTSLSDKTFRISGGHP